MAVTVTLFTGCETDEPGTGWTEMETGAPQAKKDFDMNNVEALESYALKVNLINLEYIGYMSNGLEGNIFCGPGEKSDASRMFELQAEILDNKEQYLQAVGRVESGGTYTTATTRGAILETIQLIDFFASSAEKSMDAIHENMRVGNIWKNPTAMKEMFDALKEHQKLGETDYKKWFIRLNNRDPKLVNMSPQLHCNWVTHKTSTSGGLEVYYDASDKTGTGNIAENVHVMGAAGTTAGIKVMVSALDEITGGAIGTMQDIEDTHELVKKIRRKYAEGKLSRADIKKALEFVTVKALKRELPDDLENKLAQRVLDNTKDRLEAIILADDDDGEVAAGQGKQQFMIEFGKDMRHCVALNENSGEMIFILPNNKGTVMVSLERGKYKLTSISKDGSRITTTYVADLSEKLATWVANPASQTPRIVANPSTYTFDAAGGNKQGHVSCNAKWVSAKTSDKWIKVGIGVTGYLDIWVEENKGKEPRTGTVTVSGSNDKKKVDVKTTVTVIQAGVEEEVQPELKVKHAGSIYLDFEGKTTKVDGAITKIEGVLVDEKGEPYVNEWSSGIYPHSVIRITPYDGKSNSTVNYSGKDATVTTVYKENFKNTENNPQYVKSRVANYKCTLLIRNATDVKNSYIESGSVEWDEEIVDRDDWYKKDEISFDFTGLKFKDILSYFAKEGNCTNHIKNFKMKVARGYKTEIKVHNCSLPAIAHDWRLSVNVNCEKKK